jgi:hypothetical protein
MIAARRQPSGSVFFRALCCACLLAGAALFACAPPDDPAALADPGLPNGRPPASAPPANSVGGFEIVLPAVTLQPGEEKEVCFAMPLVLRGPSRMVSAGVVTTGPGLHHGNITTRAISGDGVRRCGAGGAADLALEIAAGGSVLFASSTQVQGSEWQSFPAGYAYRISDRQEIVARMHYLNASTRPLVVAPRYQWFTIADRDVQTELGPFAWTYFRFRIPPRSTFTVQANCPLSRPMQLVQILPHMHALGRRFTLRFSGGPRDGQAILDQTDYGLRGESDIRQFMPAVELTQGGRGDGFRFSCTWENTFDKVIEFGVGDNEMCIAFGYAYPPAHAASAAAGEDVDCLPIVPPRSPG